jgi:hypothetical protein
MSPFQIGDRGIAYVYSSASVFISKIDKEPFYLVMTVKIYELPQQLWQRISGLLAGFNVKTRFNGLSLLVHLL